MKEILFKINIEGQDELQSLDSLLKENANSFGQLQQRKEKLEQAFAQAKFGTPEFIQLQAELRKTNTELKNIDETISDISLGDKAQGLVMFGQAAAGAFGIATAATSQFGDALGVSEEDAAEAEQRFLSLLVVLQSLEAIGAAFSKDNKLLNAFGGISTAANNASTSIGKIPVVAKASELAVKAFGTAGKIALASIGIGLLITGVALLVEYWDDVKKAVVGLLPALGPVGIAIQAIVNSGLNLKEVFVGSIAAITASIGSLSSALARLVTGDFKEAAEAIKQIGTAYTDAVNESRQNAVIEESIKNFENLDKTLSRQLARDKARGKDTITLEREILQNKQAVAAAELSLIDTTDKKYEEANNKFLDAQNALAVFEAGILKKRDEENAKALAKRLEEQRKYNERVTALEKSLADAQLAFDTSDLSNRRATLDKLFELQRQYAELTITNKATQNATLLQLDRDYYAQVDELLNANATKQLESTKLTAEERTKIVNDGLTNEIDANATLLSGIDTTTQAGIDSYSTLLQRQTELNIQRLENEKNLTLALAAENNARKIAAIDAIETGSDPNLVAEKERQIAEQTAKFEADKVNIVTRSENAKNKIRSDANKTVTDLNKKLVDTQKKAADESLTATKEANEKAVDSAKETISTLGNIAQSATATINAFFSAATAQLTEQLNVVKAEIDGIQQGIDAANERRNEALAQAEEFDSKLEESQDKLSELQADQASVAAQLATAIANGNTAAITSLTAQQNELAKRIAVEKRNKTAIQESSNAARDAAKKEEENVKKLQAERDAAATKQRAIELEQQELQKQRARIDRIAALAQVGLAIASIAASSARQDFTFGVATIASIAAVGAALVAAVIPLFTEGFAEGGFTGNGSGTPDSSGFKVAGVVHEGEYVVPKRMVESAAYKPIINDLERARTRGYATGGFVQNTASTGTESTLAAIAALANRPVVVAVTDIVKETNALNVTVSQNRV
jgi:hypothetical protein